MSEKTTTFDKISSLIDQIGAEKQAAGGQADPGTTHPTGNADAQDMDAPSGAHAADNSSEAKKLNPDMVDNKPKLTPENAPKQDSVRIDDAKAVGEAPSVEKDYKDRPTDSEDDGQGGTSHPASAAHGDKYSSDEELSKASAEDLYKVLAELGNKVAADIATLTVGKKKEADSEPVKKTQKTDSTKNTKDAEAADSDKAEADGAEAAKTAASVDTTAIAGDVIDNVVKTAVDHGEMVGNYLENLLKHYEKISAEEEEEEDPAPLGGTDESESGEEPAAGETAGGAELLAQMGAETGAPAAEADPLAGLGDPAAGADPLAGLGAPAAGADPLAGLGDPAAGADPLAGLGAPAAGADPLAGLGAPGPGAAPAAGLGGDQDGLTQLLMALLELGITPEQLAAIGGQEAPKLASAATKFQRSGKFRMEEAKEGSFQRNARDYIKNYIGELWSRSQK